ncbi:sigma-54-dependent Fis family transcriptional regulator [Telmatocola sphagniphila]|uniref:Sigma-54-dependent Fis family transcriptional regulator n=1 Tax=Telmatocola sphagniphila TaxID=1123043 RepID=A0A8E6EX46_9BACT|nr:sigma-54 dependent transcriptional regulator [Telmatocola sphagniphila]QVL34492.1 sigma-54-dependent Fis family transcriptional regulator [Telmatocola sphagniphila]
MSSKLNDASILIVDDEKIIRETLSEYLEEEGFTVKAVGSGEEALALLAKEFHEILICDINLPGMDGIEVLQRVQRVSPETFVILITAYATVETAIEAFQRGAQDYLIKPIVFDEVTEKLRRLMRVRNLRLENQFLRRELNREASNEFVIGANPKSQAVFQMALKAAPTGTTILIQGESGTGKEILARYIHKHAYSNPEEVRFLPVNCAAIPNEQLESLLFGYRREATDKDQRGVFVHAGKGTVFLDEIGELPASVQAKLLRVIEQKEVLPLGANEPVQVHARIIAATNKDLNKEVENGTFRNDLYYRLNVVSLKLPPLRERKEDIPELVDHFVKKHAARLHHRVQGLTHEAMNLLMHHPWKGNLRELENSIERSLILSDQVLISPAELPPDLDQRAVDPNILDDLSLAMGEYEKLHIERILRQTSDKREAAKRLNIGLSSLYRKIELLKIEI